ncbi:terminase small subunit [Gordonibacter sp.]|uniref:terminase small subunit n=1 Tax=Gordonibacter sp. TaxID=1968902 RepID=UPI002FC7B9B2
MTTLTEKQKRFCDEYLTDLNATQAAIRAGYSARSARQHAHALLGKQCIRDYLDERLAEMEDALIAKSDEVLKYLTAVMRGDDREQRVVIADGCPGVESYTDQRNRIKAAELLARCSGLMVQKVDIGDCKVTIVDDLAPDDG